MVVSSQDFKGIWEFLNQNLIAEAIGALVFGLVASFLFNKYSSAQQNKVLAKRMKVLLRKEVKENLRLLKSLQQLLNEDKVNMYTGPFSTSSFQIVIKGAVLETFRPELSVLIIDLHEMFIDANDLYERLLESVTGMSSALGSSVDTRQRLVTTLKSLLTVIEKKVPALLNELKDG